MVRARFESPVQPAFPAVAALVFLPFVAAALVPLVYRVLGERTAYFGAAVAAACFGLVASQYGARGAVGVEWIPTLGASLSFYVDGLALLIGFLASGIGVLIFVYSAGYMHGEENLPRYYAALLAFMGAMLGVAFAADLIALFVFWELTSLSSYVLIGHYRQKPRSRYAARKAMLITVAGGLFMLVGFLALHSATGTFDLAAMLANPDVVQSDLREAGLLLPVIVLVGVGAAAKSAQVPLHVWLPDAMEAPTPVSAFLHSATMVKAGVYLVGRFRPLLSGEEWMVLFVGLGLLTMTVAAMLAVAATDTKELLAYSTASHLGLIVAAFGFTAGAGEAAAVAGGEAGAFHILNHALFKAPLFLVAGILAHEAGTRAIDELGGLWRDLPVVAAVAVVASLGMAGIPPFNGFYSKELLFEAAYEAAHHLGGAAWLLPVLAVFGSIFTVLYSLRFLMLFFGEQPDELGDVHRPPVAMLAPAAVLGALALVVGLVPEAATTAIVNDAFAGVGGHEAVHAGLPTYVSPPVVMSAATIGLGLAAFPVYDRLADGIGRVASGPLSANWYYDGAVSGLNGLGGRVAGVTQTGLLRTYVTWSLGATSALVLAGYLAAGASLPAIPGLGVSVAAAIVLLVAVLAAAAVGWAPSHVAGVLTLSILGFVVAVFYVLASAPDLALTQLVVETLVLVIFLLVLDRLPAYYGESMSARALRDGALAILVGVTVTVTVLLSTAAEPDDAIASYFVENAVPEGGGGNVVNVILVDFRAFDTMGEISVIAMAALSVLTLIAMRGRGESQR